MTTTGQCARRRQSRATGPRPGAGPEPRANLFVPRTSISASAARSSSAGTGSSLASSVVSRPGGRWGRASSAAAASIAPAAAQRSSSRVTRDGEAYGAPSLVSPSQAQTRQTAVRRSRASRTAQRTAATEAADPLTPTTIWRRALAFVIACSPPGRGVARVHLPLSFSAAARGTDRGVGPIVGTPGQAPAGRWMLLAMTPSATPQRRARGASPSSSVFCWLTRKLSGAAMTR